MQNGHRIADKQTMINSDREVSLKEILSHSKLGTKHEKWKFPRFEFKAYLASIPDVYIEIDSMFRMLPL